MSEATEKTVKRSTEKFFIKPVTDKATYVKGYWKPIKFHQLKQGDVFRLWDGEGDNRKPDRLVNGKHDVCVALDDAFKTEKGVDTVNCVSVNL